jgi:uroporphyrinogen-III synthase
MVTEAALAGQKILVTRPRHQSEHLAQLITAAGGQPLLFPVIAIQHLPYAEWQKFDLKHADWLIFVSSNAVDSFMASRQQNLPENLKYAAVGGATAKAMQQAGLRVDCKPVDSSGSEGLLMQSHMQNIAGSRIIIVRGVGGREHLADTLVARGASISYVEVYQRQLAKPDSLAIKHALEADKLVCNSVAGVDNLGLILAEQIDQLQSKPLVVVSDRIKQHAEAIGYTNVTVSADASDAAVLNTLMEMDK